MRELLLLDAPKTISCAEVLIALIRETGPEIGLRRYPVLASFNKPDVSIVPDLLQPTPPRKDILQTMRACTPLCGPFSGLAEETPRQDFQATEPLLKSPTPLENVDAVGVGGVSLLVKRNSGVENIGLLL